MESNSDDNSVRGHYFEKHVKELLEEKSGLLKQAVGCSLAVICAPIAIMTGGWGAPQIKYAALGIGFMMLIMSIFKWIQYKRIHRQIESMPKHSNLAE